MTFAATFSRGQIGDYLADCSELDTRQHGAYLLLTMRYRTRGPLPMDDVRLADICKVSKRVWQTRIWPVLKEFFTLGDDGMIHHEDLDRQPDTQETKRSAAGRAAAKARWDAHAESKRQQASLLTSIEGMASHPVASDRMADASQSHMRSHTENPAISMPVAFTAHANASPTHADASALARAPSPSLSTLSSTQDPVFPTLEREGISPRADASGHATGMRSDAIASAPPPRQRPERAFVTRLPDDWAPDAAARSDAAKRGYDVEERAAAFRAHYRAKGETRADWHAAFIGWNLREERFNPSPRLVVPAPAPVMSTPPQSEAEKVLRREWIATVQLWRANGCAGDAPPNFETYAASRTPPSRATG